MGAGSTDRGFPLRFVTATALFDGHDAAINLVRRLLQAAGVEVVHLGHNRSVAEIVAAVVEEDVHGVAVSSYQGGHMEFFSFLVEELRRVGRGDARVFAGGGGVIVPDEAAALERAGVAKVFTPEDGARLGLEGMARWMVDACRDDLAQDLRPVGAGLAGGGLAGGAGSLALARWNATCWTTSSAAGCARRRRPGGCRCWA